MPHAGGDDPHNACADKFPPNRYPGKDVLIGGIRFDALQVGVRVLWEIKTDQFDTYSAFLQGRWSEIRWLNCLKSALSRQHADMASSSG
ncbi:hypothetical protein DB31_5755 [Hyalangium minutum]|uniref:DUF6310 domain-containing protein n=1 Tax=Hyalangium minutum TaxID=394096 RepID=A0A085WSQ0_9BACT|nr:hypothetical protein DB31_5755 [Hyalangium minutum]